MNDRGQYKNQGLVAKAIMKIETLCHRLHTAFKVELSKSPIPTYGTVVIASNPFATADLL
jgi:hypothetical protein